MAMTHTHAKDQGQGLVSSKDRVETVRRIGGQMDRSDCITSHANVVGTSSCWHTRLFYDL